MERVIRSIMGRCKISTNPRNYRTIADFQVRTSKSYSQGDSNCLKMLVKYKKLCPGMCVLLKDALEILEKMVALNMPVPIFTH